MLNQFTERVFIRLGQYNDSITNPTMSLVRRGLTHRVYVWTQSAMGRATPD